MSRSQELREERLRVHAEAVRIMNQTPQTPETRAKVTRLLNEADALGIAASELEQKSSASSRRDARMFDPIERRRCEIFGRQLRNKATAEDKQFLAEHRDVAEGNLLSQIGTYTGLGFFVPAGFVYEIENALKWYAPLADPGVFQVIDTASGQPLPYPTSDDTSQRASIVGEGVVVNEQDITAGHVNLGAWKYSSGVIRASLELVQDSAFDLESWLSERMGIRFARGYEADLTNGSGVNSPTGLLTAILANPNVNGGPVVAQGSSESSGGTETGANSVGNTDLVKLMHSVDPAYRMNGKWMLHDQTLSYLKRILDKFGRPLWTPGLKDGAPDTILGKPYIIDQALPTLAASAQGTVVFGDLKRFVVRRVMGYALIVLNERFADFGEVGYIAFSRLDANLVLPATNQRALNIIAQHS